MGNVSKRSITRTNIEKSINRVVHKKLKEIINILSEWNKSIDGANIKITNNHIADLLNEYVKYIEIITTKTTYEELNKIFKHPNKGSMSYNNGIKKKKIINDFSAIKMSKQAVLLLINKCTEPLLIIEKITRALYQSYLVTQNQRDEYYGYLNGCSPKGKRRTNVFLYDPQVYNPYALKLALQGINTMKYLKNMEVSVVEANLNKFKGNPIENRKSGSKNYKELAVTIKVIEDEFPEITGVQKFACELMGILPATFSKWKGRQKGKTQKTRNNNKFIQWKNEASETDKARQRKLIANNLNKKRNQK